MTAPLHDGEEGPHEVAAGWVARQRSGAMTEQEARDLETWLKRDSANREAFEHVSGVWRTTAGLRTDPQIMALRAQAMGAYGRGRRWWVGGAIAAGLLVAVFGGWGLVSPESLPGADLLGVPQRQVFRTGIGQTATVTLEDGSIVTLDTNTRLSARETPGRRMVELERGQAFFKVAHDPSRPFTVTAGDKKITALGTAFNVRLLKANRVEVVLAEGRVKVASTRPVRTGATPAAPPVADMTPGSRLIAAPAGDWQIARVDVDEAISWRTGQLTFVRRPLGSVAEELNRYSQKKIVIHDAVLAAAPITGGFAAGDVDRFVVAIEGYGLARVTSDTDAAVVLQAP